MALNENVGEYCPVFSWDGETKFLGRLEPGATAEFTVRAIFTSPGVYDINRWKMTTSLSLPKKLIESSNTATKERLGARFAQIPTVSLMVEINQQDSIIR